MEVLEALQVIDALVKLTTVGINAVGGQAEVSAIIARRVADGRTNWTDADKQEVQDAMDAARARALAEAAKP